MFFETVFGLRELRCISKSETGEAVAESSRLLLLPVKFPMLVAAHKNPQEEVEGKKRKPPSSLCCQEGKGRRPEKGTKTGK